MNPVRNIPSLVTSQLSSKLDETPRPYNPTLPTIPEIVDTKIDSDIKTLVPTFESAQIPWIEHDYKSRNNQAFQELGKAHAFLTRTRRKSSAIVKVVDLLKLLYMTRSRSVGPLRVRLALLEISHRRRCAGKVGKFSMGEMRSLIKGTKMTEAEILKIVRNPRVDVDNDIIEEMAASLSQHDLSRDVWVPRRLIRYLAAEGSRLEIATMLVAMIRRIHSRFNRARFSARMVADIAQANEKHVRAAILKLQERKLIQRNRQAERWSVNKWGSLYDFPDDLSIDPHGEGKPVRAAPKKRGRFVKCLFSAVFAALAATTRTDAQDLKGANLIKLDPTLHVEQQLIMQNAPPSTTETAEARRKAAAAAAALEFDLGPQGMAYKNTFSNVHSAAAAAEVLQVRGWESFQRYRLSNTPHIPKQAPWQKRKTTN